MPPGHSLCWFFVVVLYGGLLRGFTGARAGACPHAIELLALELSPCAAIRAAASAGHEVFQDQLSWLVTYEPSAVATGLALLT